MTPEMLTVFVVLAVTIVLFVSDRIRLDLVAMMALTALLLLGILTPEEALSGFADPIVMIIAALFVVGGGLFYTGVAGATGRWLSKVAGTNLISLTVVIVLVVGMLSAFMSSTGAVAVLVPVVMSLAWSAKIKPSKLLMPLAFGSLIGGMITLIGTPPNIVVSNVMAAQGYTPFSFFDFAPFGLVALGASVLFMVLVGRFLLPDRDDKESLPEDLNAPSMQEMADTFELPQGLATLRVRRNSSLVDKSLAEADVHSRYGVNVLEIQSLDTRPRVMRAGGRAGGNGKGGNGNGGNGNGRGYMPARAVDGSTVMRVDDLLHVQGAAEKVTHFAREQHLGIRPQTAEPGRLLSRELGMAEVMPTPDSDMLGRTLRDLHFRRAFGVTVMGIRRMGKTLAEDPSDVRIRFGDTLLVEGPWERIEDLRQSRRSLVVIGLPKEIADARHASGRAPLAVLIMLAMLLLVSFELLPMVTATLLAAGAMALTGCLPLERLYRTVNWESIVLIAGMLPMSLALQKTGGVEFIADLLTNGLGQYGPLAIMAGLFIITSVFSQFISNTATTVLIAPIALRAAMTLGIDPHALMMGVAVAASSAFLTPIASPVNTIILGPGGYRFSDFVRVGAPLWLLMLILSMILLPILFPW